MFIIMTEKNGDCDYKKSEEQSMQVVMENAARREARLEKAKEAEKAVAKVPEKGGIHGKLEKAKNEMKAKETSKIPKDKSRDLATVL